MSLDRPDSARPTGRTTRDEWLQTALDLLVSEGVDSVKILTMAQRMNCARSSFYWFFKNRSEVLDALLDHWQNSNTRALVEATQRPSQTIIMALVQLYASWTDSGAFDMPLDFAIRDWARRSEHVRTLLDQSDTQRIDAIAAMFERHGYPPNEADIRGRIVYLTQIGYATVDQRESWETRIARSRDYLFCMTGVHPTEEEAAILLHQHQPPASRPA